MNAMRSARLHLFGLGLRPWPWIWSFLLVQDPALAQRPRMDNLINVARESSFLGLASVELR